MNWVETELGGISLGDKRLEKRAGKLLKLLGNNPEASLPEACGGWHETKAAYRFFENSAVTSEKILKCHIESTIKRMEQHDVVLLLQDTTQLDYSTQYQKQGIGPLKNKHNKGILLHPSIAVTPEKLCLGVVDDYHWFRDKLLNVTKKERSKLNLKTPITEKESYRWILSYKKMNTLAQKLPKTQLINIADREGDIYDLYYEACSSHYHENIDWLIRAVKNRPLLNKSTGGKADKNLWDKLRADPAKGQIEFSLPRRGNKPARPVTQIIKASTVWLYPPSARKGKYPCEPVQVNAIMTSEINSPSDEKPIEWLFITSLPITTLEELKLIFQYYLCRWQIEVFFRVLKSGCNIEKLQLKTAERMDVCLALYLIVAWRVLFITQMGKLAEDSHCEIIFDTEEWQTLYILVENKKPPQRPLKLNEAIRMLAKLGGFLDRKSDGPPGPTTLWKGLAKLKEALFVKQKLSITYG